MPRYGAKVAGDCVACPAGYQCASEGTVTPTPCPDGQYCAIGTGDAGTTPKPEDCPTGSQCPIWQRTLNIGSDASLYPNKMGQGLHFLCGWGFFASSAKSTACTVCTKGMMCNNKGLSSAVACTDGYFCLAGDSAPRLCDEGLITVGSTADKKDEKADC